MFPMERWVKHHDEVLLDTTIEIPKKRGRIVRVDRDTLQRLLFEAGYSREDADESAPDPR